jgi:hypothetical protein
MPLPGEVAGLSQAGHNLHFSFKVAAIQAGEGTPALGGSFVQAAFVVLAIVATVQRDFANVQCFIKPFHIFTSLTVLVVSLRYGDALRL